jgi:hypothetical protein
LDFNLGLLDLATDTHIYEAVHLRERLLHPLGFAVQTIPIGASEAHDDGAPCPGENLSQGFL